MPARFAAKNRDATPSIKSSIFPCFASNSSTALLLQPISRPISAAAPGLLRIVRRLERPFESGSETLKVFWRCILKYCGRRLDLPECVAVLRYLLWLMPAARSVKFDAPRFSRNDSKRKRNEKEMAARPYRANRHRVSNYFARDVLASPAVTQVLCGLPMSFRFEDPSASSLTTSDAGRPAQSIAAACPPTPRSPQLRATRQFPSRTPVSGLLRRARSVQNRAVIRERASLSRAESGFLRRRVAGVSEKGNASVEVVSHVAVSSLLAARGAAASVESSRAHVATLEGWRGRRRRWVGYCRRTGSPHVRTALRQRRERVTTLWSCS